jgi:hypothetical protein
MLVVYREFGHVADSEVGTPNGRIDDNVSQRTDTCPVYQTQAIECKAIDCDANHDWLAKPPDRGTVILGTIGPAGDD